MKKAITIIVLINLLLAVGCGTIKGYVAPYARNPDIAYDKLCGEEGAVMMSCVDTPSCREAMMVCELIAISLTVIEGLD